MIQVFGIFSMPVNQLPMKHGRLGVFLIKLLIVWNWTLGQSIFYPDPLRKVDKRLTEIYAVSRRDTAVTKVRKGGSGLWRTS